MFRALAETGRRALLDALFVDDGQCLNELCDVLPDLTRFGVMKHLAVLESAGLLTTEKVGREKRHYLNPIPIQQIHDRWLSKYAQRLSAMTGLKRDPETPIPATRQSPKNRRAASSGCSPQFATSPGSRFDMATRSRAR